MLVNVSIYLLSPAALLVLGFGIYYIFKASWINVFLLTGTELLIFALIFGASWIIALMGDLCDGISGFLHS